MLLKGLEIKKEYLDKAMNEIESYSSIINDLKKLKLSIVNHNHSSLNIGIIDFSKKRTTDKFYGFEFDLQTFKIDSKNYNKLSDEQFQAALKILNKLKSEK